MKLREHQDAMLQVCEEIKSEASGARKIIVCVTPGGGKSVLPQIIAKELMPDLVDAICWVVPRDALRKQGERDFGKSTYRALLNHSLVIRAATNEYDPLRALHGYITTHQAIQENNTTHIQAFARRRYALIIDECHHIEEGSLLHTAMQPLVDAATVLVLMTGTPERGDKHKVAFMPYVQPGRAGLFALDLRDTPTCRVIVYSRRDALREQAIIPIEFYHIDGSTNWLDATGTEYRSESLAEEEPSAAKDALFTALGTKFAYQLLDQCLDNWRSYQVDHPRAKMLVVADKILTAKKYLAYLHSAGIRRADIAVSDKPAEAQAAIDRFKLTDNASALDILVTVGMAYEGLDVPEITHLACLTHIRSRSWLEQMFARLNRVDPAGGRYETQRGWAYCPDDIWLNAVIRTIKEDQDAVAREKPTESMSDGDEPEPIERHLIVPLDGTTTRFRASDLEGDIDLGYETTETLEAAMRKNGVSGVSVHQIWAVLGDVQQGNLTPVTILTPTAIPPSQEEAALRTSIKDYLSKYESDRRIEFGTLNRVLIRHYDKSREDMTLVELRRVWAYIQRVYPMRRGRATNSQS